jgi:3-deoxy-manno-octulosonate cytidylyltransferase (CMP-KDO synthetase)
VHVLGVIAARMASTRYPDKPMAQILGVPMIGHVLMRSAMAERINDLWVATCDQEIVDYVESIGGRAVMTSDKHERALDRVAEAADIIEGKTGTKADYVALIQGDEPMLLPGMLDELVAPVTRSSAAAVNLIEPITEIADFESADTVKVVLDRDRRVLYFSREPIPSRRKYKGEVPMWKQLGLILLSRKMLADYSTLEPTDLEVIESVDMNRLLGHGFEIIAVPTTLHTHAVDRPADVPVVEKLMQRDALLPSYRARALKRS